MPVNSLRTRGIPTCPSRSSSPRPRCSAGSTSGAAELIGQLRRTASAGLRATTPGPPIREVVLDALDELGWPQNARFLEEYLWAKRQLQLDSRAFASLRRDELRAWRRSPGARSAYIVPALNPDGSANPRWLTSSAWDLPRRVIASAETERLFDLQKILAMNVRGSRGPVGTLLERNVTQILAIEPPPVSASVTATRAWRAHVRSHTAALIEAIRSRDDADRDRLRRDLRRSHPWGAAPDQGSPSGRPLQDHAAREARAGFCRGGHVRRRSVAQRVSWCLEESCNLRSTDET